MSQDNQASPSTIVMINDAEHGKIVVEVKDPVEAASLIVDTEHAARIAESKAKQDNGTLPAFIITKEIDPETKEMKDVHIYDPIQVEEHVKKAAAREAVEEENDKADRASKRAKLDAAFTGMVTSIANAVVKLINEEETADGQVTDSATGKVISTDPVTGNQVHAKVSLTFLLIDPQTGTIVGCPIPCKNDPKEVNTPEEFSKQGKVGHVIDSVTGKSVLALWAIDSATGKVIPTDPETGKLIVPKEKTETPAEIPAVKEEQATIPMEVVEEEKQPEVVEAAAAA